MERGAFYFYMHHIRIRRFCALFEISAGEVEYMCGSGG